MPSAGASIKNWNLQSAEENNVAQVYIPEKKSAIDKIMQGLQVAQSVYGVKSAYDQNKLNQIKMQEVEKQQEQQKRADLGEFTEAEAANLYRVEPETKGAAVGWVNKIDRTPSGKVLYEPETGQPKTRKEKFYYITKELAQVQNYLDKQSQYAQQLDDIETRAAGGIPKSDIMSGKVKNWSTTPQKDTIESWFREPETQEKIKIWISKDQARAIKSGAPSADANIPLWAKKNNELLAGFSAAQRAGIPNPTEAQALEYSPTFIDKKIELYDKGIDREDYDLWFALKKVDDLIDIDNPKKNENIPGITDVAAYIPTSGWSGRIAKGSSLINDQQRETLGAIDGVVNIILKLRSGAAITVDEAERLKSELNLAYGNRNAAAVRKVMGEVRDKLKAWTEKQAFRLPQSAKIQLKDNPNVLSPYSDIFQKKKELSDEDVAKKFMEGQ